MNLSEANKLINDMQLKDVNDMVGKTVKTVKNYLDNVLIGFTDNTFVNLEIEIGYEDAVDIVCSKSREFDVLRDLEIISEYEYNILWKEHLTRSSNKDKEKRRLQYEQLKKGV